MMNFNGKLARRQNGQTSPYLTNHRPEFEEFYIPENSIDTYNLPIYLSWKYYEGLFA